MTMANHQQDLLKHAAVVSAAGKKASKAVHVASMFANSKQVKKIPFWAEDYDALCKSLREHGYRADGFFIGDKKATRYEGDK